MQVWDVMEPRARQSDPETSHQAAKSVRNCVTIREAILTFLLQGPKTDCDLERDMAWMAVSPSGLRTRRAELVKLGKVCDSGQRRVLLTGRKAIVWRAV